MPTSFPENTYPRMIVDTPNLIHYMRYDDANNNSSGDDADGLSGSGVNCGQGGTAIAGDAGKSRYFNGSNSYISYGNTNALTTDFTIEVWVYPATNYTSGFPTFLSKENWGDATYPVSGWSFFLQGRTAPNGGMRAAFSFLGSLGTRTVYSDPVPVNQWTHLVVTRGGGMLYMYQNGVLKWDNGSGNMSTSHYVFTAGCATNWAVQSYSDWYHGYLDELAIYHRALSQTEIVNHYNRALTPPNTNTYLTTGGWFYFSESSSFSQWGDSTVSDATTLTGTETYIAQRDYVGADGGTITSIETVDNILAEFQGDKLYFFDSPTWVVSDVVSLFGDAILDDDVRITEDVPLFDVFTSLPLIDGGTLGVAETWSSYNIIDSRYHGKIQRERVGLLNQTVHRRFASAEQIQFPHNVAVRIGFPEDDYFVVRGKEGQFIALGRMTTVWDGPRYAARRRTVEEETYVAATSAHTTIEFFRNPYDHPDILAQFELPAQTIG